jgi:hypothetical protein
MSEQDGPQSTRGGQSRSPFTTILEQFCQSVVGGMAAGLADEEGECVDLAAPPVSVSADGAQNVGGYVVKLAAAHWQLVMREAVEKHTLGGIRQLWVNGESFGCVVVGLFEGYVLVLLCTPAALPAVSQRAIRQCEVELSLEAGWPVPRPELAMWKRVGVMVDGKGLPQALRYAQQWHPGLQVTEILATVTGFERGYRVCHDGETELDLVRDAAGFWYVGGSPSELDTLKRR